MVLLIIASAALGIGLVLAHSATYGVKVSYDSVAYISAARSLLAGEGLALWDGTPYSGWPPLYPALLAVAGLGLIDPHDVAGPLNAFAFGLTIVVLGLYLKERLVSRFLLVWTCVAVALCLPLTYFASLVASEPVFILMSVLALICTDKFLGEGKTHALVWAALFSALAFLQRSMGVAVSLFVGLLLISAGRTTLPNRLRHLAIFAAIAGAPVALWMTRNYLAVGEVSYRRDVDYELAGLAGDLIELVGAWLYPRLAGGPQVALQATFAVMFLTVAYLLPRRIRTKRKQADLGHWRSCLVFGGFALTYAAFLLLAMMLGLSWDGMRQRFPTPMYIPLLTALVLALDKLLEYDRQSRPHTADGKTPYRIKQLPSAPVLVLLGALTSWLVLQVNESSAEIGMSNSVNGNLGFHNELRWTHGEMLRYLEANPLEGLVYSNRPVTVALFNGGTSHLSIPGSLDTLLREAPTGANVVWVNDQTDNPDELAYAPLFYNFGRPLLRQTPGLELVMEFRDGAVFKVNRAFEPKTNPHRDAHEGILAGEYGEPVVRSTFHLYLENDTLIYFKRQCGGADQDRLWLRYTAAATVNLVDHFLAARLDTQELDFAQYGTALEGGQCIALVPLPGYEVERINTGQVARGARAGWVAELSPDMPRRHQRAYEAIAAGGYGEPATRTNFDIYLADGTLIYFKHSCALRELTPRFFLHIFPADLAGSEGSNGFGFINADFSFTSHWTTLENGPCIGLVPLPHRPIERIRTGQFAGVELWSADLNLATGRQETWTR